MAIVHVENDGTDTQVNYLSSPSSMSDVNGHAIGEELVLIRLVDVDLSTGKKYVIRISFLGAS